MMSSDTRKPECHIGRHVTSLPTPSLIIKRSVLQSNIDALHRSVERLGIQFRPHVKTLKVCLFPSSLNPGDGTDVKLKSLEVTRLMLEGGKHRRIVASTLPEIIGALPLVREGLLDEVSSFVSRGFVCLFARILMHVLVSLWLACLSWHSSKASRSTRPNKGHSYG